MKMEESYANESYKVLSVSLRVGEAMPLHQATSDAFIVCKKGKGKISFSDHEIILSQGETLLIKARQPHKLEVLEDFSSCIVLNQEGRIEFNGIKTF